MLFRSISCANNVKQIGLAMHNYHGVHEKLPPSRLDIGYATWAVLILPSIEQDNLYYQWKLGLTYYQQNTIARRSAVKIYSCPSRRTAGDLSTFGDFPSWLGGTGTNIPGALGDYVASVDPSGFDAPDITAPSMSGAFAMGRGVRFADFTDGLSNTFLIGEKHVPIGKEGIG